LGKPDEYILQVGDSGADRLLLLDEVYGPYSREFLKKAQLGSSLDILDVGCGTGNIALWMAKEMAPQGHVVGVDASQEQVKIASEQAKQQNINNVEFIALSVYDLKQLERKFDLVSSRFLINHLSEPKKALKAMYDVLKPGGIIVCDEQVASVMKSYPESSAFNRFVNLVPEATLPNGLDFDIGFKMPHLLMELNLDILNVNNYQPILMSKKHKMLWLMAWVEAKEAMLDATTISAAEYDESLNAVAELIEDPSAYFASMQNFQVMGKKKT